jgi:hypothetical protein
VNDRKTASIIDSQALQASSKRVIACPARCSEQGFSCHPFRMTFIGFKLLIYIKKHRLYDDVALVRSDDESHFCEWDIEHVNAEN